MKKALLAGWLLLIGSAMTAQAQQAPDVIATGTSGLEEIVVTAQKRSENIQNVPIAVTAISGEALADNRVYNAQALSTLVPSLNYGAQAGFTSVYLRGIGSDVNQPEAEPSVATFVDGVYIASQQGMVSHFVGLDRVEVLAGPQGTLYGRNASAGAINFYTLTPEQKLDGAATVSYGNLDSAQFEGHMSGGVSEHLSVGLYAVASIQDAVYTFLPPVAVGQSTQDKDWGLRLKAVWEPVDGIKLTGSVERTRSRDVSTGVFKLIQPDALSVQLGGTFVPQYNLISANTAQFLDVDTTFAILREEVALGFANLVGITGWRDTNPRVQNDFDGTSLNVVDLGAPLPSKQESQEFQLLSLPDSPISWIAGLFYFHEHGGYLPIYIRSSILFQPSPIYSSDLSSSGTTTSYAGYVQATAPLDFITSGLRLILGGRYTRDTKTRDVLEQQFTDALGVDVVPPAYYPELKNTWSKFTPKVTLEYQTTPALYYLTYAQGYKSGLFNLSTIGNVTPVQPEQLNDYEAGIKSDLFDRRVRLNLAAYYYDFKNLQVQVLDPSGTLSAVIRNATSAKAYGLELTSTALLTESLTANLDVALEHTEYDSFPDAPYFILGGPGGNTEVLGHDASGLSLKQAPSAVGTAGLDYQIPLASGDQIDLKSSVYHNGGFKWDQFGQIRQSSYNLLNASITYTLPNKHWKASFWGQNLTNTQYFAYEALSQFGITGAGLSVRTYGASVSWQTK